MYVFSSSIFFGVRCVIRSKFWLLVEYSRQVFFYHIWNNVAITKSIIRMKNRNNFTGSMCNSFIESVINTTIWFRYKNWHLVLKSFNNLNCIVSRCTINYYMLYMLIVLRNDWLNGAFDMFSLLKTTVIIDTKGLIDIFILPFIFFSIKLDFLDIYYIHPNHLLQRTLQIEHYDCNTQHRGKLQF